MKTLLSVTLLGAMGALPAVASAQVNVRVAFGTRLGPEIEVFAYSPQRLGDWRGNYRRWTPVTLYDVNGHYYRSPVRGARPVLVYVYEGQYFFPPQDRAWVGFDKRYNYSRRPIADDERRVHPYAPPPPIFAQLGAEIGVLGYSRERAGDWRKNYRHWTPVVVYEYNGRYYQNNVSGTRPVAVYRYRDEYFLPPPDQDWRGVDRRFNDRDVPNDDDRRRVRNHP